MRYSKTRLLSADDATALSSKLVSFAPTSPCYPGSRGHVAMKIPFIVELLVSGTNIISVDTSLSRAAKGNLTQKPNWDFPISIRPRQLYLTACTLLTGQKGA
jgi:hypothetical protein